MCGLYDRISIDKDVPLPHFPEKLDKTEIGWQSKDIAKALDSYRITNSGTLLRKVEHYREKTDDEKLEEAQQWGFDSWDEYIAAYEDSNELIPERIEYDLGSAEEMPPAVTPTERTLESTEWVDHNYHGSFEFYTSLHPIDGAPDIMLSYESRFTSGELDKVVLLDGRHTDNSHKEIVQLLEEWDNE